MLGKRMKVATGVLVAMIIAGCAGSGPTPVPEPKSLALEVKVGNQLNPHADGSPQSVDLLILYLESQHKFEEVTLSSLYPRLDQPRMTLGPDLIDSQRIRIAPGKSSEMELSIDPRVRYIGLVAAFEQFQRSQWRSVVQMRDESALDKVLFRDKRLTVSIDELQLSSELE